MTMKKEEIEKTAQDVMQILDGLSYEDASWVLHRVGELTANFLKVIVPEEETARHAEGNSALVSNAEYIAKKLRNKNQKSMVIGKVFDEV